MRIILRPLPRLPRRGAVALLALLLPAACASDNLDLTHSEDSVGAPVTGGATLSGNYLAGRHAQSSRALPEASLYLGRALELSPQSEDLLRRTFILMASEGRIEEAAPLAAKVLENRPDASIAGLAVVVNDLKHSRWDGASKKIAELPDSGLNNYMAPLLSAWAAIAEGENAAAAIDNLKPLQKDGSMPLYHLHKALIYDFKGDFEKALGSYQDGIKVQGGISLRIVEFLGNLYERSGKTDKAEALYAEYAKRNPQSPVTRQALKRVRAGQISQPILTSANDGAAEGFFGIATTLSQQNAQETALLFARLGLYLQPDFPVMQILLGNILQSDSQLENANVVYQGIDTGSAYSWPARMRVAENLDDLDRTEDAANALKAMAAEEPDQYDPLVRLGDILRSRERFEEAVVAYDQAFERIGDIKRHHWSLLYARGIVLERSKQWDRAEVDFLKALEFEPDQPFILNYLGYSWVDQGKYLDRAKEMIRKAVSLRPNDGYIVDSLGWAHFRLGEFKESAKEMERAVEMRPEDPILNDHLGDALWRVDRKIEARYQWQRVLTLEPDDDLRQQVEGKLKDGLPDLPKKDD